VPNKSQSKGHRDGLRAAANATSQQHLSFKDPATATQYNHPMSTKGQTPIGGKKQLILKQKYVLPG